MEVLFIFQDILQEVAFVILLDGHRGRSADKWSIACASAY